ncbi:MAG: NUDIX hydrolase [Pseudomonadota bacterium]|nr:NUDIX hydrolase [Pseudomonadota bacterium]
MTQKPFGSEINYCPKCGNPTTSEIPPGDNRARYVCRKCHTIHYENPRMVVGCIPEHRGSILLCKRSIQPRVGYWTVPAGFMELEETLAEAAIRETWEEAKARVTLGPMLAVVDVTHARQVHIFFRAELPAAKFEAGHETSEARLFSFAELPWGEIAFPSVRIALEQLLKSQTKGDNSVHLTQAPRIRIS